MSPLLIVPTTPLWTVLVVCTSSLFPTTSVFSTVHLVQAFCALNCQVVCCFVSGNAAVASNVRPLHVHANQQSVQSHPQVLVLHWRAFKSFPSLDLPVLYPHCGTVHGVHAVSAYFQSIQASLPGLLQATTRSCHLCTLVRLVFSLQNFTHVRRFSIRPVHAITCTSTTFIATIVFTRSVYKDHDSGPSWLGDISSLRRRIVFLVTIDHPWDASVCERFETLFLGARPLENPLLESF